MTALLGRLMAAIDAAVETVIDAAVDVLIEHWVKTESPALCGNPTKANDQ